MSRTNLALLLILFFVARHLAAAEALDSASANPSENGEVLFYDIVPLGIEGRGWDAVKSPFDRLPAKAEGIVRPEIWNLSRDSAGLCVRFVTNATEISARWWLINKNLAMPHMPATGVSGLDLYVRTDLRDWRWLANGRPTGQTNTTTLVSNLPPGKHEFMLYLPLYNGVSSVEIGIPKKASIFKAEARPTEKTNAIVFYGTSITQGGCASRPGMAHPAILGRRLDRPVINLGFSGNGLMESEIAALLSELDAAVYVIECVPNMDANMIAERTGPLVAAIRRTHATTPILLVEDRTSPNSFILEKKRQRSQECRAAPHKTYDALVASGDKNIHYLTGDKLLAADGEDTVDGSHPTDLGFVHLADAMQGAIEKLLNK